TGHAALCELNYTPEKPDGAIDITKALKINEQFEVSKQFWAYLVENEQIAEPDFIQPVPHMSFVSGDKDVAFLKKRYAALSKNPFFKGMQYTEDHDELRRWIPLVMEGRDAASRVAATRIDIGTDVNFGALTRHMINNLAASDKSALKLSQQVQSIKRNQRGGYWEIAVKDLKTGHTATVKAKFIFIGAGGGTLPLLM